MWTTGHLGQYAACTVYAIVPHSAIHATASHVSWLPMSHAPGIALWIMPCMTQTQDLTDQPNLWQISNVSLILNAINSRTTRTLEWLS